MWWVDRGGRAPSGFLKLVAFVDAGAIAAAVALAPVFPRGDLAEKAQVDAARLDSFGQALIVVTILVIIQLVTAFLPARGLRIAAGILTTLAGVAALGVAAPAPPGGLGSDPIRTGVAIAAVPAGAGGAGGADGALLLRHLVPRHP